jgi:hypothetical protein
MTMAFAPDGATLAAASDGGRLLLWDPDTGKEIRQLGEKSSRVKCVAFSPDGRTLATSVEDGTLRLWEVATGRERFRLGKHRGWVWAVAYSPDGRLLASGGDDSTVRVWDAATGKEVRRFEGHAGYVWAVAFAPDGKTLASAGGDATALLWDVSGLAAKPATRKLEPAELEALWPQLADDDAARAYLAVRALVGAGEQALALLQARLKPAVPADVKRVARLITELSDPKFMVRNQAELELEKLGELAWVALEVELREGKRPLETQRRLEALLRKVRESWRDPSGAKAQELRALEALEGLGTPAARKLVRALAEGAPGARLTREARAALERLERRRP